MIHEGEERMREIGDVGAVKCQNPSRCLKDREVSRNRPYFEHDANPVPGVHGEVNPVKGLRAGIPIADDGFGDERPCLCIPDRQPDLAARDAGQINIVASDVRGNPRAIATTCVQR